MPVNQDRKSGTKSRSVYKERQLARPNALQRHDDRGRLILGRGQYPRQRPIHVRTPLQTNRRSTSVFIRRSHRSLRRIGANQ